MGRLRTVLESMRGSYAPKSFPYMMYRDRREVMKIAPIKGPYVNRQASQVQDETRRDEVVQYVKWVIEEITRDKCGVHKRERAHCYEGTVLGAAGDR